MEKQSVSPAESAAQVRAISSYIARGIAHGCGNCVGLELEHFIVHAGSRELVTYEEEANGERAGVEGVLWRLASFYEERIFEPQEDGSERLIGLSRQHANITLEPGAQFEISIGPVFAIGTLEALYRAFLAELDPILAEFGYELLTIGYHPSSQARDIPLIPKTRYRYMDKHFKTTGQHGICMMRATASTQVSIDYASETDAICKFRIANALSPLLAFITDNSPVFEGAPVGGAEVAVDADVVTERLTIDDTETSALVAPRFAVGSGLAIPERMARTIIWDDVDAQRAMTAPGTFDEGFDFDSYAATILKAPAIFTLETDDTGRKRSIWQGATSFAEAFAGRELDRSDIEHILSLFFFDVRFKTYVEIRAADSLPLEYALAFAALIKGLFYSEDAISTLAQRFEHLDAAAIAGAKIALRLQSFEATVYDRTAAEWLDELVALASASLAQSERGYLAPLAQLVASRTTLVDRYSR